MKKLKILSLTAVSPDIPEIVFARFKKAFDEMIKETDNFVVSKTVFDDRVEPSLPNDWGAASKLARIRNAMIDENLTDEDFVFWIDSDLVEFSSTLLVGMHHSATMLSRRGIIAPMNLIEGTEKWYDWGAFIQSGTDDIQPQNYAQLWGRNVSSEKPYFHPGYLIDNPRWVRMDSVAQCVLIPSKVYRKGAARHLVNNVFFEFHSVCQKARELRIRPYVDRELIAFHADRSLYGRNWG